MQVDNERALRAIFENARLPIVTHCENNKLIEQNMMRAQQTYGADPDVSHHSEIRDAEVCYTSTRLAVALARETGARLHVAHVSTARELEFFSSATPNITAEACVGHLLFCDEDYARLAHASR